MARNQADLKRKIKTREFTARTLKTLWQNGRRSRTLEILFFEKHYKTFGSVLSTLELANGVFQTPFPILTGLSRLDTPQTKEILPINPGLLACLKCNLPDARG